MAKIQISRNNAALAIKWCTTNIGPPKYHLHNQVGGHNWRLCHFRASNTILEIDDDKLATIFALSHELAN